MTGPVGGVVRLDTCADHHVELLRSEALDQHRRRRRVVGHVAVGEYVDVGVNVGEHAPDHVALALVGLAADDSAGCAGDLGRSVG